MTSSRCLTLLAGIAVLLAATTAVADLERDLERTYKGAWVLTNVEVWSDCSGFFTNNDVNGTRVSSKGDHRFDAGELGRIEKLSLKSDRLELYLVVDEPLLVPRREGPFTLLDERSCKAEVRIALPRELVRAGDPGPVNALVEDVLATVDSREAGRHAAAWNQRVREPYPADYEEILARYAAWKVEQENARIAEVQAASLEEASRITARLTDDPDYLRGFAAGVDALRTWSPPMCSSFASTSFYSAERSAPTPPRGVADTRAFARGFKDGQALVFHLEMARRARGCFQPPPPIAS